MSNIAGTDYNAYSIILADVQVGTGVVIFEDNRFDSWNI
jgi:hypothetical protein